MQEDKIKAVASMVNSCNYYMSKEFNLLQSKTTDLDIRENLKAAGMIKSEMMDICRFLQFLAKNIDERFGYIKYSKMYIEHCDTLIGEFLLEIGKKFPQKIEYPDYSIVVEKDTESWEKYFTLHIIVYWMEIKIGSLHWML